MKKTAVMAVLLLGSAAASSLLAQGSIVWGNIFGAPTARVLLAPIYGVDPSNPAQAMTGNTPLGVPAGTQTYGGPLLAGTGFTAALYSGASAAEAAANMTPLLNRFSGTEATATFLTAGGAGLISQRTVFDPNHLGTVSLQMRAWDNRGGTVTSWAAVLAAGGAIAGGVSDVFTVNNVGADMTPPQTLGLRSFQLTLVPEPSLIALGVLGLGALLFHRRK